LPIVKRRERKTQAIDHKNTTQNYTLNNTKTPLNTDTELILSEQTRSTCSTNDTRRVTRVKNIIYIRQSGLENPETQTTRTHRKKENTTQNTYLTKN